MTSLTHSLQILIKATDKASPTIKGVGGAIAGLIGVVTKLGAVLTVVKFAAGVLLLPLKLLATAGVGLVAVLGTLTVGVIGLVSALVTLPHALATGLMKLTEYAAELDLVRRAFLGVAGEGAPAMLKALKASTAFMVEEVDLLETYNKAYTLLGKNLADKLPEMMGYLTKVAAATGDDVTRLAELTIRSVGRMSTRWMAYVGVMVTVEEAQVRAAEMFDTTTDALTRQQEQAGLLDLTLERLEARTSAMPEVMGTAAQMAASLRVAYKELYGDLTTFLLPVVRALYPLVMKIVTGFRALISEGGALYKPIRTVTATFVVLIEVLEDLWDKVRELTTEGSSAIENFANKIISMGWKAFSWGAHMITNFAAGIIKGASIALIAAMNFISGLLAHWLGPGSPPLVASNIDLWGASAFTEFLKGFSMADFDVLEGIQAPLKRALDILVDLERLTPIDAFNQFVSISADLAAAIDELNRTGNVSASMLERLSQVGGAYGDELAELFRRYAGLHAATEAYAAAQERLKRATEAEDAATKQLSKEAREYNKLVRAGADPAVLRGKLAGVKASYDALEAARLEAEEAEEAEERAKEQLRLQREQVRLQERLLNQLIAMAEAQAAALAAAAGGGEDGAGIPPIEWPDVYPIPIDQAFEDLKEAIRAKFQALWAELTEIWKASEAGKWVQRLQERWDEFRTDTLDPTLKKLKEFWDLEKPKWISWLTEEWDKWGVWWAVEGPRISGFLEDVRRGLEELGIELPTGEGLVASYWESWRIGAAGVMETVRLTISLGMDLITGDWEGAWETLQEIWQVGFETVDGISRGKLSEIAETINNAWEELKTKAAEDWEELKSGIADAWEEIKTDAAEKWEEFRTGIAAEWALLKWIIKFYIWEIGESIKTKWEEIKKGAEEKWNSIKTAITIKVLDIYNKVRFWIAKLKAWLETTWNAIKTKTVEIFGGMYEAVKRKIQEIYNKVTGKIREIKNKIGEMASQFWGAGWNLIKALGDGMGALGNWLKHKLRNIIDIAIAFMKQGLGWGSPPKVLMDMGEAMVEALAIGMDKVADLPAASMARIAKGLALDVTPTFLGGVGAALGAGGGAAAGVRPIVIHNHYGRDSIRSDADVYKLSKQMARQIRLRGSREML